MGRLAVVALLALPPLFATAQPGQEGGEVELGARVETGPRVGLAGANKLKIAKSGKNIIKYSIYSILAF